LDIGNRNEKLEEFLKHLTLNVENIVDKQFSEKPVKNF